MKPLGYVFVAGGAAAAYFIGRHFWTAYQAAQLPVTTQRPTVQYSDMPTEPLVTSVADALNDAHQMDSGSSSSAAQQVACPSGQRRVGATCVPMAMDEQKAIVMDAVASGGSARSVAKRKAPSTLVGSREVVNALPGLPGPRPPPSRQALAGFLMRSGR